jgi:hypothetical protein
MRAVRRSLPCLWLACALPAWSQFQAVPKHEYREVIDPKRPVSGHSVVGMSLVGGTYGRTLNVYIAEPIEKVELRVDVESPDGRLHGTALFRGSANKADWYGLTLMDEDPSRKGPDDARYGELALAVRVVSAGGKALPPTLLPASWEQPPPRGQTLLQLQVNSRRAEMFVRGRGDTRKCRRAASASWVRFDAICEMPIDDLVVKDGRHSLTLLRRDGFAIEPLTVEVRI